MTDQTRLHQPPATSSAPPPAVVSFLDGTRLEDKVGTAVGITTTDPDGWPHPAQLSAGEILLSTEGEIRLAVHAQTSMADNLRRDGRLVLMLAADGANNELRFQVTERAPLTEPPLATFSGTLVVARTHRSPYADVVDGVRYTLHDTDSTVERWRRQIDGLRNLDESGGDTASPER